MGWIDIASRVVRALLTVGIGAGLAEMIHQARLSFRREHPRRPRLPPVRVVALPPVENDAPRTDCPVADSSPYNDEHVEANFAFAHRLSSLHHRWANRDDYKRPEPTSMPGPGKPRKG